MFAIFPPICAPISGVPLRSRCFIHPSDGGPRVRILLPPAASPVRTAIEPLAQYHRDHRRHRGQNRGAIATPRRDVAGGGEAGHRVVRARDAAFRTCASLDTCSLLAALESRPNYASLLVFFGAMPPDAVFAPTYMVNLENILQHPHNAKISWLKFCCDR